MAFNPIADEYNSLAPGARRLILAALNARAVMELSMLAFMQPPLKQAYSGPTEKPGADWPFTMILPPQGRPIWTPEQRSVGGRVGAHRGGMRWDLYHFNLFLVVGERLGRAIDDLWIDALPWIRAVDELYSSNRTLDGYCHECWIDSATLAPYEYADELLWGLMFPLTIRIAELRQSS